MNGNDKQGAQPATTTVAAQEAVPSFYLNASDWGAVRVPMTPYRIVRAYRHGFDHGDMKLVPFYATAPVAAAPLVRRAIADEAPFGLTTAEKVSWARGFNDGLERMRTPAAPGIDLVPRPMATTPRDGTMLRLQVQFDENATEDTEGPAWTIGANNDDNVGEDEHVGWQFAGWCWTHDHFTEGKGTPVGWLPLIDASPNGGISDAQAAARYRHLRDRMAGELQVYRKTDELSLLPGELDTDIDAAMQPTSHGAGVSDE